MRYFNRLHVLLAAVFALSLAGKVASNQPVPLPDHYSFAARLENTLRAGDLNPYDQSLFAGNIAISAKNATCEVWATEYSPYGTMADVILERASSVGKLRYIYNGKIHAEPPPLAPLLSFYWWRELKRIGIDTPRSPVIALAASKRCDLSAVPWQEIAALPPAVSRRADAPMS